MQQVLRAAIQCGAGHDVRASPHQRGNAQVQRGLPAGGADGANAALQRRDTLLQHCIGRVADAGVNMPCPLQVKEGCGVVAGLKHKRGGEVNWHGARARGGVWCGTCVQGQGVKTRV